MWYFSLDIFNLLAASFIERRRTGSQELLKNTLFQIEEATGGRDEGRAGEEDEGLPAKVRRLPSSEAGDQQPLRFPHRCSTGEDT